MGTAIDKSRRDRRWILGVVGALVLLVVSWWIWPQSKRDVGPRAYAYATSLYSICNRADEPRLRRIETMVNESLVQQEISADEARWLLSIIQQARRQQWDSAAVRARKLLEDQVEF